MARRRRATGNVYEGSGVDQTVADLELHTNGLGDGSTEVRIRSESVDVVL